MVAVGCATGMPGRRFSAAIVGGWWPQTDPEDVRGVAQAQRAKGAQLLDNAETLRRIADSVAGEQSGRLVDGFVGWCYRIAAECTRQADDGFFPMARASVAVAEVFDGLRADLDQIDWVAHERIESLERQAVGVAAPAVRAQCIAVITAARAQAAAKAGAAAAAIAEHGHRNGISGYESSPAANGQPGPGETVTPGADRGRGGVQVVDYRRPLHPVDPLPGPEDRVGGVGGGDGGAGAAPGVAAGAGGAGGGAGGFLFGQEPTPPGVGEVIDADGSPAGAAPFPFGPGSAGDSALPLEPATGGDVLRFGPVPPGYVDGAAKTGTVLGGAGKGADRFADAVTGHGRHWTPTAAAANGEHVADLKGIAHGLSRAGTALNFGVGAYEVFAEGEPVVDVIAKGAGSWAGMEVGAGGGALAGALCGPAAPITVPAFTVLGGIAGAVGGEKAVEAALDGVKKALP